MVHDFILLYYIHWQYLVILYIATENIDQNHWNSNLRLLKTKLSLTVKFNYIRIILCYKFIVYPHFDLVFTLIKYMYGKQLQLAICT